MCRISWRCTLWFSILMRQATQCYAFPFVARFSDVYWGGILWRHPSYFKTCFKHWVGVEGGVENTCRRSLTCGNPFKIVMWKEIKIYNLKLHRHRPQIEKVGTDGSQRGNQRLPWQGTAGSQTLKLTVPNLGTRGYHCKELPVPRS